MVLSLKYLQPKRENMLQHCKRISLCAVLLLSFTLAQADSYENEINHLLLRIEKTKCLYIRNGTSYTGTEAVKHIKKKYNYFEDDIQSAEDFIRLSASKSTLSGSPYYIKCENKKKIKSALWLQNILNAYRKNR